jgi:hypothetical protein
LRPQAGYALLYAIFLSATLLVLAAAAAPSILNQGRREREQQLIWRGNQYVRGIRLYFQKNGRFPQNKEELLNGTLDVHFVRKAFKDPVNAAAGDDWRMIYVSPSGQLTGSVRYHSLQEMAAALGGGDSLPNLATLLGGGAGAQAGAGRGGAPAAAGPQGPARGVIGRGGLPGAPPAAGADAAGQGRGEAQPLGPLGQPIEQAPLEAVDGPVIGASMIGIASKVKQTSLLVYQGRDSYFDWEFIWNPLLGGVVAPPGAQQPGAAAPEGVGPDQPAPTDETPGQPPDRPQLAFPR